MVTRAAAGRYMSRVGRERVFAPRAATVRYVASAARVSTVSVPRLRQACFWSHALRTSGRSPLPAMGPPLRLTNHAGVHLDARRLDAAWPACLLLLVSYWPLAFASIIRLRRCLRKGLPKRQWRGCRPRRRQRPEHLLRAAEESVPLQRPLAPRSAPAVPSASPEANAARGSNRRSRTIAPAAQKGVCRERLNAVSS